MSHLTPPNPVNRARGELSHWVKKAIGHKSRLEVAADALAREIRDIITASEATPAEAEAPLKVAVVPGHGLNMMSLSMDMLWAMSLRLRGHRPIALMCGKAAPSCEFNLIGSDTVPADPHRPAFSRAATERGCDACGSTIRTVCDAADVPLFDLARYGDAADLEIAFGMADGTPPADYRSLVLDGVAVGDHAFASTLRVTLRGVIAFDDADERWTYRRQLISAILMARRMRRFLETERPDRVVCVHGVYLTHGTLVDVCAQLGIPVTVYGAPYRAGTVYFSHHQTYHRTLITEPNSYWEDDALDAGQQEKLAAYMASKLAGGRDVVNYHPNPILERQPVLDAIGLDPAKPIVSLFTNVIWDAQIFYSHNAFENIFEWLFQTIDYFRGRPDVQLVVRIHPAESKGGNATRQPMAPEIARRFPDLPPNVFIVTPDSDVSSYTLAEMSSANLVYGTKMALELAYRGMPVIVAGETFNRGKGFTHDISSAAEYFALLDRVLDLGPIPEAWAERARRFAHYLFFRKMMDMPLLADNIFRQLREPGERYYSFDRLEALQPGRCRNLDIICDGILYGSPLFADHHGGN